MAVILLEGLENAIVFELHGTLPDHHMKIDNICMGGPATLDPLDEYEILKLSLGRFTKESVR